MQDQPEGYYVSVYVELDGRVQITAHRLGEEVGGPLWEQTAMFSFGATWKDVADVVWRLAERAFPERIAGEVSPHLDLT